MDEPNEAPWIERALAEDLAALLRGGYVEVDELSRDDAPRLRPTAKALQATGQLADSPQD